MSNVIRERAVRFIRANLRHPNNGFTHLREDVAIFLNVDSLDPQVDSVLWELEYGLNLGSFEHDEFEEIA